MEIRLYYLRSVASKEPRDGDFFPLTVNYEEKMYVGKIPGGFKNVKVVQETKQH